MAANHIWIAASAKGPGFKLLTRDRRFLRIGQVWVEHFEPEESAAILID